MTDNRVLIAGLLFMGGFIVSQVSSYDTGFDNLLLEFISPLLYILAIVILPTELFSRKIVIFKKILLMILVPVWLISFILSFV